MTIHEEIEGIARDLDARALVWDKEGDKQPDPTSDRAIDCYAHAAGLREFAERVRNLNP